jgi:hypothetical protein
MIDAIHSVISSGPNGSNETLYPSVRDLICPYSSTMASQGLKINSIIRLPKPYYGLARGLINSHELVPGPNYNHRLISGQNLITRLDPANHITTWLVPGHLNNNIYSNLAKISKGLMWKTTKQPRQPDHGRSPSICACS